jgi:hypothetical protein
MPVCCKNVLKTEGQGPVLASVLATDRPKSANGWLIFAQNNDYNALRYIQEVVCFTLETIGPITGSRV